MGQAFGVIPERQVPRHEPASRTGDPERDHGLRVKPSMQAQESALKRAQQRALLGMRYLAIINEQSRKMEADGVPAEIVVRKQQQALDDLLVFERDSVRELQRERIACEELDPKFAKAADRGATIARGMAQRTPHVEVLPSDVATKLDTEVKKAAKAADGRRSRSASRKRNSAASSSTTATGAQTGTNSNSTSSIRSGWRPRGSQYGQWRGRGGGGRGGRGTGGSGGAAATQSSATSGTAAATSSSAPNGATATGVPRQ